MLIQYMPRDVYQEELFNAICAMGWESSLQLLMVPEDPTDENKVRGSTNGCAIVHLSTDHAREMVEAWNGIEPFGRKTKGTSERKKKYKWAIQVGAAHIQGITQNINLWSAQSKNNGLIMIPYLASRKPDEATENHNLLTRNTFIDVDELPFEVDAGKPRARSCDAAYSWEGKERKKRGKALAKQRANEPAGEPSRGNRTPTPRPKTPRACEPNAGRKLAPKPVVEN
jgi:hypothetical protein